MYIIFSILLIVLAVCLGLWCITLIFDDKEYILATITVIILVACLVLSKELFNKKLEDVYNINLQKAQLLVIKEPKLKKPFEHFMEDNKITYEELERLNDYYLSYIIIPSNNNNCKCK